MSDLYRITDRCDTPNCTSQHVHDRNGYRRHWEKIEPTLYVSMHGGLSRAFYECDEEDADGAVFDINLFKEDST